MFILSSISVCKLYNDDDVHLIKKKISSEKFRLDITIDSAIAVLLRFVVFYK